MRTLINSKTKPRHKKFAANKDDYASTQSTETIRLVTERSNAIFYSTSRQCRLSALAGRVLFMNCVTRSRRSSDDMSFGDYSVGWHNIALSRALKF